MKYFSPLLPFLAGLTLLLFSNTLMELSIINVIAQTILFALVVCIPTWVTGRMSYVDIGWPWGLAVIGCLTFIFAEGADLRVAVVSVAYIFAGGRMGTEAIKMWRRGDLKTELPRYEYQKRRWERAGKSNIKLVMQIEGILQGIANMSFLAMPALIISSNPNSEISIFEIIGLVIWLGAFGMESIADMQKHKFIAQMKAAGEKNKVCNIGLWKYSRHPNYFAEWMVWNGLVIAAIPSWIALYNEENIVVWALLAVGVLFASKSMYTTLVYYTGAIPAEYYSVKKRPEYKAYQETTNIFFPGPNKK
ncbi:DUF1295 domain-containing protein [Oceaniserpentilla sp. 4NH20-0058]|uniref:DUF1295 domain-containing protein n=1 Tax=Oceaniserpentilla sp. 4NH20-0058 TaxID=3127660 RepID=UPI00310B11A7